MERTRDEWKEFIREQAEEHGVPFRAACEIFSVLGPNEAHDGFVTSLEDYAMMYGDDE